MHLFSMANKNIVNIFMPGNISTKYLIFYLKEKSIAHQLFIYKVTLKTISHKECALHNILINHTVLTEKAINKFLSDNCHHQY